MNECIRAFGNVFTRQALISVCLLSAAAAEGSKEQFGIRNIYEIELGVPYSEAAQKLESQGFEVLNGRSRCFVEESQPVPCTEVLEVASRTQRGKKEYYALSRTVKFQKDEVSVQLFVSENSSEAPIYGISRREEFGRNVADLEPVETQIAERIGDIYNMQPCAKQSYEFHDRVFILDRNWNYVPSDPKGWKSFCAFPWQRGFVDLTKSAEWFVEQPEIVHKYTSKISFLSDRSGQKITSFVFELFDNELAAQAIVAGRLEALQRAAPEKTLSKDF